MGSRRKHPASIEQHEAASAALQQARAAVHDALRALGLLQPGAMGPGSALAAQTDALLKIERTIDRARHVCEEQLARDHPGVWSTKTYYPGRDVKPHPGGIHIVETHPEWDRVQHVRDPDGVVHGFDVHDEERGELRTDCGHTFLDRHRSAGWLSTQQPLTCGPCDNIDKARAAEGKD